MAGIGNERWGQYKKYVLEILAENPEGMDVNNIFLELDERLPANDFENANYESNGRRRRPFIVRFATISIVKAGWLIKNRGQWQITSEGIKALNNFPSAVDLQREASRLYKIWKNSQPEDNLNEENVEDESIALAVSIEDAESNSFSHIYQYLSNMPPYSFQDLVKVLLDAMGYKINWVAPPGKDGGVDIIAYHDHLGAMGSRIKVQVKRQASTLSVSDFRSFSGVLNDSEDIGLFVSLGGFSSDAEREARSSNKRITLVDAKKLYELWISYYDKLSQADRALFPLKPIYYLNLEE
jgi:restriction system protein